MNDQAASTTSFINDSWDSWWETNKFDFIELQRVEDAITATQGNERETPAEREIRLAAVRSTVREKILPVLRELTASDDPAVRSAAIVSLAKLHDESCTDLATRMLADGSLQVRRSAMLALGVLTSGRASWVLMNIANDNSTGQDLLKSSPISVDDRGTALLTATLRGDMAIAQLLNPMLNDRGNAHPELLALAADAAGLMGSTDAIRPLIDMAFDSELPEYVRSAATSALGRIGDPSVTPALMKLLDTGVEPRRAAAAALGLVAHPGAAKVIERLTGMLEHESDAVSRHFAAVSLGRIGGTDARNALRSALVSPRLGDDMRPWVALGLGLTERDAPGDSVVPLLVKQMKQEANSSTTAAYAVALGLCRSEQAMPTLLELSRNKRTDVAGYAALALGLSGQHGAASRLREMISTEGNPLVVRQAAMGLGILGDRSSIPDLLDLIRTTNNPFVASFAAIGIGFTGDSNAAGPLLDLIEREGPRGVTTTYAVNAVGQLFDRDRRPALSRLASGDNYIARTTAVDSLLQLGF
jgi:HEAT repeat protein